MKLDSGQRHFLRLIRQDADADGWAKVSHLVWPLTLSLPDDLVERRSVEADEHIAGYIRLTERGDAIVSHT